MFVLFSDDTANDTTLLTIPTLPNTLTNLLFEMDNKKLINA